MSTLLVEITAATTDAGSTTTLRFGTEGYNDSSGPGLFKERIKETIEIRREIRGDSGLERRRAAGVSFSDLILINADGDLDDLEGYGFDGREIKGHLIGNVNDSFSNATTLFVATMGVPSFTLEEITIPIQDRLGELGQKLHSDTYAGTNVLPDGLEGREQDIKGQPKPEPEGRVLNASPPFVNTSKLIYEFSNGVRHADTTGVFEGGIQITRGADYTSEQQMLDNAPSGGEVRVLPRSVLGKRIYVLDRTQAFLFQYETESRWELSTGQLIEDRGLDISNQVGDPQGAAFKDDGAKFYVIDSGTDKVYEYTVGTAWDIATASFNDVSFDVSGEDEEPRDVIWKRTDGTKMFILGNNTTTIYGYVADTGWDLSTVSLDTSDPSLNGSGDVSDTNSQSGMAFRSNGSRVYITNNLNYVYQFDLSTDWDITTISSDTTGIYQATDSTGSNASDEAIDVDFKSDGTKMFTAQRQEQLIKEHSLSTAWDITSASQGSSSSDLDVNIHGIYFQEDGTRVFVTDNTEIIRQFDLSTAWDITSLSTPASGSLDVSGDVEETNPRARGIFLRDNGSRLFVEVENKVLQYDLGTDWDISTASFFGLNFSPSEDSAPSGIWFKEDDGSKLFILGGQNEKVYEYSLPRDWIVSRVAQFDFSNEDSDPQAVAWKDDGTKLYMLGNANDRVFQYSASTAWDPLSLSIDSGTELDISNEETKSRGIFWKSDGTQFYVIGQSSDKVWQYDVSSAWDIGTASLSSGSELDISSEDLSPVEVVWRDDNGETLYMVGGDSRRVYEYDASTAWDPSSGTVQGQTVGLDLSTEDGTPEGFAWKDDGTKLYMLGNSNDRIFQYDVNTAWAVDSASIESGVELDVSNEDADAKDIAWKEDGTRIFVLGDANDKVFQYSLTSAWDISTASIDSGSELDVSGEDTSPVSITFSSGGGDVHILGSSTQKVYQYSLGTDWDISTASLASGVELDVSGEDTSPSGIEWDQSGDRLFLTGNNNDIIFQYDAASAFDLSGALLNSGSELDVGIKGLTDPTQLDWEKPSDDFGGYFRLGSDPTHTITCDIEASLVPEFRTPQRVLKALALRAPTISGSDINESDIEALATLLPNPVQLWQRQESAILAEMEKIAGGAGMWFGFDRKGNLRMDRWLAPANSVATFRQGHAINDPLKSGEFDIEDIEGAATTEADTPVFEVILFYRFNHTLQADLQTNLSPARRALVETEWRRVKRIDTSVQKKHKNARSIEIQSQWANSVGATESVSRILDREKPQRRRWELSTPLRDSLETTVDLGDTITIDLPRLNMSGGKLFNVRWIAVDPVAGRARLGIWG